MNGRRQFIRNAAWASASAALGFGGRALAAEPPPETKRIRIGHTLVGTCRAPQYVADDSEDTVRFYALRLQEAGLIKSNPKKIVAQATDFRFLNELKKELKA